MTRKDALKVAVNAVADVEVKAVLEKMLAALEKESGRERKPSKTQVENAAKREEIYEFLASGEKFTATEVAEHFAISNQRATALIGGLLDEQRVVRTVEKRKAYFAVA